MAIVFRYRNMRRIDGTLHAAPFIPVRTYSPAEDTWFLFDFLIDSGADATIITKQVADVLGLEEHEIPTGRTSGIGGEVRVKGTRLTVIVTGAHQHHTLDIDALVLQDPSDIPCLLGRNGFFERFDITFRQADKKITLKPRTTAC